MKPDTAPSAMNILHRIASATLLLGAAIALTTTTPANPIQVTLDYSNTVGSYISFDGQSHFSFSTPTNSLQITSAGSATGLLGDISGVYTIGAITTIGSMSTATVSGDGQFLIHDGAGFDLTGSLVWQDIMQIGTADFLNTSGSLNVTNITYGGTNVALMQMAVMPGTATDVLSFQFASGTKLTNLKNSVLKTSFSGEIAASRTPEIADTAVLAGTAIAFLILLRRRTATLRA
jgi:hypothetical protein